MSAVVIDINSASHRYRGGHGFESHWSPDYFRFLLSSCLNWKNLLRWSLFTFINNAKIKNFEPWKLLWISESYLSVHYVWTLFIPLRSNCYVIVSRWTSTCDVCIGWYHIFAPETAVDITPRIQNSCFYEGWSKEAKVKWFLLNFA